MSAALEVRASPNDIWAIGAPRLLAGAERFGALDLRTHLAVHGPMPGTDLPKLLGLLAAAGLSGRGGAGFALGAKLAGLRGTRPRVVVNGSESEPASHKDRTLMRRAPHLVLDGALAVSAAARARSVTVAVHDPAAASALRDAVKARPDTRHVRIETTGGGFVAGEARALVRGLNGGPALPPGRQEHLNARGVLVANAETFAQTAVLLRLGSRGFASTGTRHEPGTTLLTIGGAAGRPGVVEVPLGTPLDIVLRAAHADDAQYVITGGYHGTWIRPVPGLLVSRAGLAEHGATLGAGVLRVLDSSTCALGELTVVTRWLAAQSAGQCGPCRFGLPALAADVAALQVGHPADKNAERHAELVRGRGACSHPDGTSRFVRSALSVLRGELELHRRGGCGRPVRNLLAVSAT